MSEPLLQLIDLAKTYRLASERPFGPKTLLRAVDGVNLTVTGGRSFGIVGESGSGKSTLARCAIALERPTSGEAKLMGRSLNETSRAELRRMRAHMQMIFQDPYGSLDPRQTIQRIVAEPLACLDKISRGEVAARVALSLEAVGLGAADEKKYPHEFSGGQRQRIAIARALITRPKLVVADEPVSALDVSVQAQVLNLMTELQQRAEVTYLLISHDLAVVEHVCDEIAVIYRGRFVETGPTETLLSNPAHPYTRALLDAAPKLQGERRAAPVAPMAAAEPMGAACPYAARCPFARARCRAEAPLLRPLADGRRAACHFPLAAE
ncbi:MAG TPA: oligopeptide/dipeptide ABC transporter ATP-binding protein [Roseiarcus sp.]|nr:oligopeptide/dipeptide ABC transporter ATP-binding protein [Roseiarcus sp.]